MTDGLSGLNSGAHDPQRRNSCAAQQSKRQAIPLRIRSRAANPHFPGSERHVALGHTGVPQSSHRCQRYGAPAFAKIGAGWRKASLAVVSSRIAAEDQEQRRRLADDRFAATFRGGRNDVTDGLRLGLRGIECAGVSQCVYRNPEVRKP
jgi:hypothetical protein